MSSETISLFLNKALQKILKDSSRRHTKLRDTIKVALDAIQGSHLSPEASPEWDKLANKLVIPLKHACETRQSKIMGVALDCLQKLMAYGLIRGTAIDEERPDKKLMDNVIETIGACFDFPDDNVQLQIIKAFLTAVTSPICDIHDTCLMNAIRSVYNIYLVTKNQVNITTAKATLTQMLNIVFQRLETPGATSPNGNNNNNNNTNTTTGAVLTDISEIPTDTPKSVQAPEPTIVNTPTSPSMTKSGDPSVHFTDCFLIFRALCKLSMKEVPEGAGPEAMDMKSKVLSLELIQMILESSGPSFRHSERFINNAIKKYLCVSLLNNGVSPTPRVFKLSLSIFLSLMSHYREHLKAEIGVFFSKIFLWILESNNSTIQQKWMVLQVLYQICKNPQTLVDIYVNYDCDLEGKDIFERMVYDLSRIAQGGNTVTGDHFNAPAGQELKVKTLGLECLVTIMKSLVDWSKELYEHNEKETPSEVVADGSSSTNTTEDMDALDVMRKQKQFKLVIETGKQKFNMSPKKGIDYLVQGEAIERQANSIALFLKTAEGLDKTRIGEYLGDGDPFVVTVLYAYVDLFSFSKMPIDAALRDILSYFRLPSDLHKIDRMLEKFAERYFNDNPNSSFANADSVYTLAFVVVTLLTNLHDPNEQTRMNKQDWFKMNKGCNDGKDFEYNMLYVIYDNCAHEPLRLRGEKDGYGTLETLSSHPSSSSSPSTAPPITPEASSLQSLASHFKNVLLFWSIDARQKQLRFIRESEELVKDSQASIQEKMKRKARFFTATHIEHVRPMFELAWCPMLAAFSVLLEDSGDAKVIALCLEGFNYAIQVACVFYMAIERSTFITSLSKFTLLDSLREMKPKNIESIKAVINLANSQGNYLQESWSQVLKCFSLLERLHVIGSGVKVNTLSEPDPKKYTRGFTAAEFFGAKPNPKAFEEVNAEYVAQQIDTSAVDRVYTNSVHLNNSAILSFVRSLCEVSVEEISNNAAPRIFSLQKLVEICYYNMNRLRIVWASIWTISAEHFTKIGCHENKGIAMYAIDSLRQLSMKFLEKDELAHYTFQKEFLRPFEHIIHTNSSVEIRELVIRCLTQMIQAQGKNIKSGWKSVFLVFSTAAGDKDAQIVTLAFTTVDHLMQDYFVAVADNFFIDCVSCVAAFGWNKHDSAISHKAIDWLNFCSGQLYSGKVEDLPEPNKDGIIFTNSDRHTALWFPILTGMAKITHHKDPAVRLSSLQMLFRQLTMYGKSFSKDLWGLILQKVLLPIFEPTGYDGYTILTPVAEDNEWLNSTCTEAFRLLIEFYTDYFDTISFLLYAILDLVVACILQENETLSKKSLATLLQLTLNNGSRFPDEMWSTICSEYNQIFEQNIPSEIYQLQSQARAIPTTLHARSASTDVSHSTTAASPTPAPVPVTTPTSASAPPTPFITHSPLSQSIPQISIDGAPVEEAPVTPRLAPVRVRKTSSTTHSILNDIARNIRAKCTVQLLAIQAISDIFATQYTHLGTHHMVSFIDTLDVAYNFAYKINREQSLHSLLSKLNLLDLIHKIELQAIVTYLQLLFKLYSEATVDVDNRRHQAEIRLISRCASLLSNVEKGDVASPAENPRSRDNSNTVAVVVQVLKGFLAISDEQFSAHLPQFYGEFVDLMLHNNKEIRMVLSDVMQRVGPTFDIIPDFPTWLDKHQMEAFLDKPKPRSVPTEDELSVTSPVPLHRSTESLTVEDISQLDDVEIVQEPTPTEPESTPTEPVTEVVDEPTQAEKPTHEEPAQVEELTQVEEPAKVEESTQEEPAQAEEPTEVEESKQVEEPKEVEVEEPTQVEAPQQVETVLEQEVVSNPIVPSTEAESGGITTSTEIIVQEVPLEQLENEGSYTEKTSIIEVEGDSVVATGEITTVVEVSAAETEEPTQTQESPVESEVFEPVAELAAAEQSSPSQSSEEEVSELTTEAEVEPTPEPTAEAEEEPVPEPTPEPHFATESPESLTDSNTVTEPTEPIPTETSPEQPQTPSSEPTEQPSEPSNEPAPTESPDNEPTSDPISDPSELISEPSEPISEPSFESSEPSEPSTSSNDKDSNDDFVMVDWQQPQQQSQQEQEEQQQEQEEHQQEQEEQQQEQEEQKENKESDESPEETPLIPLSSSSTDDATPLVESGELEEIGNEDDDELPDSPTFSDVPVFDSETANNLVDLAISSSSIEPPSSSSDAPEPLQEEQKEKEEDEQDENITQSESSP